jgi:hypothetical protein
MVDSMASRSYRSLHLSHGVCACLMLPAHGSNRGLAIGGATLLERTPIPPPYARPSEMTRDVSVTGLGVLRRPCDISSVIAQA